MVRSAVTPARCSYCQKGLAGLHRDRLYGSDVGCSRGDPLLVPESISGLLGATRGIQKVEGGPGFIGRHVDAGVLEREVHRMVQRAVGTGGPILPTGGTRAYQAMLS